MQSSQRFNKKYFNKLTLGFLLFFILFAGAIYIFIQIVNEVLWEKEEEMDHSIFDFLSDNIIHKDLTSFMETVTYFASSTFLQIAYAVLILVYLFRRAWKRALEIAAIGLGGYVINYVMKISFQRDRPANPLVEGLENFSFPSGHATSAFIFYGLLAYLIWKAHIEKGYKYVIGAVLILFSLLIGFSRIYLRVHYPSDVLAGFCIGFAWLLLTVYLFERLKKKSDKELSKERDQKHGAANTQNDFGLENSTPVPVKK